VLLSISITLLLASANTERVSKMIDESFIVALFDSMKDEILNYEVNGKQESKK
jgi:hypothetical protein